MDDLPGLLTLKAIGSSYGSRRASNDTTKTLPDCPRSICSSGSFAASAKSSGHWASPRARLSDNDLAEQMRRSEPPLDQAGKWLLPIPDRSFQPAHMDCGGRRAWSISPIARPVSIIPILASDFGAVGSAGVWGLLLLIASLAAALALTLAAFRRTRRAGVWVSSLALLAGLALIGFYFGLLRDEHPDWIVIPMSAAPGVASAFALFWALRSSKASRNDAG